MKLVAGSGKSSEPRAFEAMVDFEMRETHLNTLGLIARFEETLGSHQPARQIACILVDITGNLPRRSVGTTLRLERADIAINLRNIELVAAVTYTSLDSSPRSVPHTALLRRAARGEGMILRLCHRYFLPLGICARLTQSWEVAKRPLAPMESTDDLDGPACD